MSGVVPSLFPASGSVEEELERHGISRREFMEYCSSLCVVLGVGKAAAPKMAAAILADKRPSVIWIQLQECTGCVESVIRTSEPSIGNLVLDQISLDFSHTLMAAAGHAAVDLVPHPGLERLQFGGQAEGDLALAAIDRADLHRDLGSALGRLAATVAGHGFHWGGSMVTRRGDVEPGLARRDRRVAGRAVTASGPVRSA